MEHEEFTKVLDDNGGFSYLYDTIQALQLQLDIIAQNCYTWKDKDPELLEQISDDASAMGNALHLLFTLVMKNN